MTTRTERLNLILSADGRSLEQAFSKIDRGVQSLQRSTEATGRKVTRRFDELDAAISRRLNSMTDRILHFGKILAGLGSAFVVGGAVKAASDFERALADINTLLGEGTVTLARYREQLLELSKTSSRTLGDLSKGLYDILSSGIPAIEGAAGAYSVLEASARAAAAGNAELSDVAKATTAILNAYKGSGLTATEVTDKLRIAVDRGVTTIPELSASLGQVVSVASAFGVGLDEVLATVAQLTLGGLSTAEAITSLRQTLISIGRPPQQVLTRLKALGVEMGIVNLKSKGLAGILKELEIATGGSAQAFADIFTDVDGLKGVLSLTSQGLETFDGMIQAVGNQAGATDRALRIVNATFDEQQKILRNRLQVVLIAIGDKILPVLMGVMERLGIYLEDNKERIAEFADRAVRGFFALGEVVARVGPEILAFFGALLAFKGFKTILAGFNSVVAVLGNAGQAAKIGADYAQGYAQGFGKGLKDKGGGLVGKLGNALSGLGKLAVAGSVILATIELGNAIGDALAGPTVEKMKAAIAEVEAETKRAVNRMNEQLKRAGFGSAQELQQARDAIKRGEAILLRGSLTPGRGASEGKEAADVDLGFSRADVGKVDDVLRQASEDSADIISRAVADAEARVIKAAQRSALLEQQLQEQIEERDKLQRALDATQDTLARIGEEFSGQRPRDVRRVRELTQQIENLNISVNEANKEAQVAKDGLGTLKTRIAQAEAKIRAEDQATERNLRKEVEEAKARALAAKRAARGERGDLRDLAQFLADAERDRLAALKDRSGQELEAIENARDQTKIAFEDALVDEKRLGATRQEIYAVTVSGLRVRVALERQLQDAIARGQTAELARIQAIDDAERSAITSEAESLRKRLGSNATALAQLQAAEATRLEALDQQTAARRIDLYNKTQAAMFEATRSRLQAEAELRAAENVEITGGGDDEPETFAASAGKLLVNEIGVIPKALKPAFAGIIDGFLSIAPTLGSALETVGDAFLGLLEAGADAFVGAVVTPLQEALGKPFSALFGGLESAIGIVTDTSLTDAEAREKAGAAIDGAATKALAISQQLVAVLPDVLAKFMDALIETLPALLAQLAQGIAGLIASLAPKIGPLAVALIGGVINALPILISAIVDAIPVVIDGLIRAIPPLILAIVQAVPRIVGTLIGAVPTIIAALIRGIPTLIAALIKALPLILSGLVTAIAEGIASAFKGIADLLYSIFRPIVDLFTGDFGLDSIPILGDLFHRGGMIEGRHRNPAGAIRAALAGAQAFATGGMVQRAASSTRAALGARLVDDAPAILQAGEGVLSRLGVAAAGGPAAIDALNAGRRPSGGGGPVSVSLVARDSGVRSLMAMLMDAVVVTAGTPGSSVSAMLDRRAAAGGFAPGSVGVRRA